MSSCVLITIAESISGYLIEVERWRKHWKRKKRTTLISNDKIKTEYVCTEEAKNRYLEPNQRHEARKKRGAIVPVSNSKHSQSKMFIELLNTVVVVQSPTKMLPLTIRLHVVSEHLCVHVYVVRHGSVWAIWLCEIRESKPAIWQVYAMLCYAMLCVRLCVSLKQNKCAKMGARKRANSQTERDTSFTNSYITQYSLSFAHQCHGDTQQFRFPLGYVCVVRSVCIYDAVIYRTS